MTEIEPKNVIKIEELEPKNRPFFKRIWAWLILHKRGTIDVIQLILILSLIPIVYHDRLAYKAQMEECWRTCVGTDFNKSSYNDLPINYSIPVTSAQT